MCGVFGYVGEQTDVGKAVVTALKTLEYRGYDSWGLAVSTSEGMVLDKDIGRINGHRRGYPISTLGLGHTRWATHGGVTAANAHPHLDCSGRLAVVHNGIIENHAGLRAELLERGHRFASETDSEVVAHLVEEQIVAGKPLAESVAAAFERLDGYNAVVVMDRTNEQLAAVKNVSPLVIGQGTASSTVASDAIALCGHANQVIYLEDDHLAILSREGTRVIDRFLMRPVSPTTTTIDDSRESLELGSHPDFLTKEVSEQPLVLRRLIHDGQPEIDDLAARVRQARTIILVGCGSAGNAALAGAYLLNEIGGREATYIPASEFRYRARAVNSDTLVIALSQSGETVDVIEAMGEASIRGARLAAIVNTPNSTLERMVDARVRIRAGVEQCVLATKSYTAMLATLILTAHSLAGRWDAGANAVGRAADAIENLLEPASHSRLNLIGQNLAAMDHLFVIGRGVHYPSALEAALKIKEVSYIHAEGFAAGELKHGVIALIEPGTPCLVFAPNDDTRVDMLSAASELFSRGGRVIGIGATHDAVFDDFIELTDAGPANVIVEAVPGQLLGYAAALSRGNDPDRPRNLAKSVTVK